LLHYISYIRRALCTLIVCSSVTALAQQPFIRNFTLNEEGTNVKVNALVQDKIGFIWIGTNDGLICYNGRNFVKIQDSINKPVTALAVSNQSIWVGYVNGRIGKVINSFVVPVNITNGPSSSVTSLYTSGSNILWASTEEQGVFVINNNISVELNTSRGLSDNFTYDLSVNKGNILAGSDIGINDISVVQNKFAVNVYTTKEGLPDNIVTVIKNIPGSHTYWVGTQEGGVAIYDHNSRKITPILAAGLKWDYGQVNDILPVAGNRAWVATEQGYLLEMQLTDSSKIVIHPYYYQGKNFRKLLLDKAGNIWCGTSQGLTMMTGEFLSVIRLNTPYSLQDVTAMICNNDMLWIAIKHELYHIYLKDATPAMVNVYTAKSNITSLYNDKEGRLWIGTLGDGLFYQKSKFSIVKVTGIDDLNNDANVLNITGTGNSLWVSGLKGVEELSFPENGKITLLKHFGKKNGIGSDYVYQLYPDHKGNIWMATDGAGVCMYDGSTYHHWDSSFGPESKVAYSITEDIYGDIWAGTMYKDLFHFHANTWENLRRQETQYPDINISTVMANATGQVISVYRRCIDEWYPQSRYFRHFNSALGLGIDSTSNVLNCAAKDKYGNIFVPYQHGILMFKNQHEAYDIRPGVLINKPTVFSKPISGDRHRFDYDENYLGFTFDGVGFANHERLNYRYMLEGYNDGWIYTNDASASFPKLSHGNYKFRVQVSLNPAFEHPNEDEYSFTIATPFWEMDWFYLAAVLLAGLLGYLYIKQREKRLKRISRLQQERMMFEYEHLKSQVNPHFLFNSLYALSILIEEKKENALSYTVHLADLYRNMLASGRKDIISLEDELEILMNYINIQQTRFEDALHLIIDIPEDVLKSKKIVPLALQLLVENAIKHNVVSIANPLNIYITVSRNELIVKNVIQPKISREKGEGIGLVNIKKRYALLTKKQVSYGIFANEYIVTLPLL